MESKSCCHDSLNFLGSFSYLCATIFRAERSRASKKKWPGRPQKARGRGAGGEDELAQHRTLIPLSCFSAFWGFLVGIKPAWSHRTQGHQLGLSPGPPQPGIVTSATPAGAHPPLEPFGWKFQTRGVFPVLTLPMETSPETKISHGRGHLHVPGPPGRVAMVTGSTQSSWAWTDPGTLRATNPRGKGGSIPRGILPGKGSTDGVMCLGKGKSEESKPFSPSH